MLEEFGPLLGFRRVGAKGIVQSREVSLGGLRFWLWGKFLPEGFKVFDKGVELLEFFGCLPGEEVARAWGFGWARLVRNTQGLPAEGAPILEVGVEVWAVLLFKQGSVFLQVGGGVVLVQGVHNGLMGVCH